MTREVILFMCDSLSPVPFAAMQDGTSHRKKSVFFPFSCLMRQQKEKLDYTEKRQGRKMVKFEISHALLPKLTMIVMANYCDDKSWTSWNLIDRHFLSLSLLVDFPILRRDVLSFPYRISSHLQHGPMIISINSQLLMRKRTTTNIASQMIMYT